MKRLMSVLGLVSLVLLVLVAHISLLQPAQLVVSPPVSDALWVATIAKVSKLNPDTGNTDFDVANSANQLDVAVDETDGTLWSYSVGVLTAYQTDGTILGSVKVPNASASKNRSLAVNSASGSVWLAINKTLYLFDDQGHLEDTIKLSAVAVGLAYDPITDRMWLATQSSVIAYTDDGVVNATIPLAKSSNATAIAVDKKSGNVWVGLSKALALYGANGELLAQVSAEGSVQLADDGSNGVWVGSGSNLIRYSPAMSKLLTVTPLPGKGKITDMVSDRTDHTVWVGGNKALIHVNGNGTIDQSIILSANLNDFALLRPGQPTNQAPSATNDIAITNINTAIPISVLTNDSDPDGDPLTVIAVTQGTNGGVTHTATTASYTPNTNFSGRDSFTYTISDGQGHDANGTVNITVNQPPQINAGPDQTITLPNTATLNGTVTDDGLPTPANLTITWSKVSGTGTVSFGNPNAANTTASFSQDGVYILRLSASDSHSQSVDDVQITVNPQGNQNPVTQNDTGATAPGVALQLNVLSNDSDPNGDSLTVISFTQGTNGTVTCLSNGNCTYTPNGGFIGQDSFTYTISDGHGGQTTAQVTITVSSADTTVNAPPINLSTATTIGKSTAFLYTGNNPLQTGVAQGTIEEKRAAVIRGKVTDRNGNVLQGVTVTVLNHPEYGQTLTRANGYFDLAVNGGGLLTINYTSSGFLPAHRQFNVPWQDFTSAPEVVLVARDSQVTSIAANANVMQVARGSIVSDDDGARRATILFPAGTGTSIVLPNGALQSVSNLRVRATEYTVGASGPKAMPAALPPTSAYTYAVELSADEAVAKVAGRDVVFSQPVAVYVENFLGFPVGELTPVGYYDRDAAAWVPSTNGRVIKITAINGGIATVDSVGAGSLAPLTLSGAELQQLASLYPVGQELWRAPVDHFSTWDVNWGVWPPPDATPPNGPQPTPNRPEPNSCQSGGSIIECEAQVLGEAIRVTGTPYQLSYRSDRVVGRLETAILNIPLSGASIPASLARIDVEVAIAGQVHRLSFPPQVNLSHLFSWDGQDAYGRFLQGAQVATIKIDYVYPVQYQRTLQFGYGGSGGSVVFTAVSRNGLELKTTQVWRVPVRRWDGQALGLGGWMVTPQHAYDPIAHLVYKGDGSKFSVGGNVDITVISTVAGQDFSGTQGDGGPAIDAFLNFAGAVAVAPDGGYYISEDNRIRRVRPDGVIETFAGTGVPGFSGDGGPATLAKIQNASSGIAVGPDGSVYIADASNFRLRRVRPNGVIDTIAGTGSLTLNDNGPALKAGLQPIAVAVASDGTIFVADLAHARIRRIGPDGIISTLAGNGSACFPNTAPCGDGGQATAASFDSPRSIALGIDASVYFGTGDSRVRRVTQDGLIDTIAGNGIACPTGAGQPCGDGGAAANASLNAIQGLAVANDGGLYIATQERLRRVGPEGIIITVAGGVGLSGFTGFNGDGGPASKAGFNITGDVALAPDGSLYISDGAKIRRIGTPMPGFTASDINIASPNGRELYQFSAVGRHLRTYHALTGAVTHQFAYNPAGQLTSITDGDGNVTTINRDGNGNFTGVVSPYGQTTSVSLDGNGYLASVTNPAKENHAMAYVAGGLLTGFTKPRGFSSTITYDSLGRLLKDQNAANGFQSLARTDSATGYAVTRTTAMGRTTNYSVQTQNNGNQNRTTTLPDGNQNQTVVQPNAITIGIFEDGTASSFTDGPDPRWGMQAPLVSNSTVTTPNGLNLQQSDTEAVTLGDKNNPLSVQFVQRSFTLAGRTYSSTYDGQTRSSTITAPSGRLSTRQIDAQGRFITIANGTLAPYQVTYDNRGRLSTVLQSDGVQSRTYGFTYNLQGYLATTTDPLDRATSFIYDTAGRLTQTTLPDGRVVQYAYDSNGNRTSITPPGKPAHGFVYNSVDQTAQYIPPRVAGGGTNSTDFGYDLDSALTSITRPDGKQLLTTYDNAGRTTALILQPSGAPMASYTYNSSSGLLASVTSQDAVQETFSYDGNLPIGTTWTGPVEGSVGFGYDNSFRINSVLVNGANPIALAYDADSNLIQAGALQLTRDDNGFVSGTSIGNVSDAFTYSSFGELTNYTARFSGSPVITQQYTRDALGRVTAKAETIGGVTTNYEYSYDLAGRLGQVKTNGVVTATFTYDSNSNRLSGPGLSTAPSYDDQDRLLTYGGTTFTYSANGELATRTEGGTVTAYNYDPLGNLKSVTLPGGTVVEYLVDGQNRRVGKKVNGTLVKGFLYQSQLNPIAELDGSSNIISRFVYASKQNVPDYIIKDGVLYRIVTDHLGSPRLVINITNGSVAQRMDYDEFGNVLLDTNPGFQPFGFAGGIYDNDVRLIRFGTRDYEPQLGRWTSKDLIRFAGGLNLYVYAENDAINSKDPLGTQLPGGGLTPADFAIIAQAFGMTVEQLTAFINELDLTPTELTQLYAILHEVLMQLRKLEDAHVAIKRSFGRFLICGAAGKLISVIVFLDPNVTNPPFDPNKVY